MNSEVFSKRIKSIRRGSTMIELLFVLVVVILIMGYNSSSLSQAPEKAKQTGAQNDLRSYSTAIQQTLIIHPELARFSTGNPTNAAERVVSFVNENLDSQWHFQTVPNAGGSGFIGMSKIKRDPWSNAYALYVYFDEKTPTYTDIDGNAWIDDVTSVTFVVMSAGSNLSGGPAGANGVNVDLNTNLFLDAKDSIHNTDGVDDCGVIIRIKDGDVATATFGTDNTTLGSLKDVQWILGIPAAADYGKLYDFGTSAAKTGTVAGSIDQYYNSDVTNAAAKTNDGVIGTWS